MWSWRFLGFSAAQWAARLLACGILLSKSSSILALLLNNLLLVQLEPFASIVPFAACDIAAIPGGAAWYSQTALQLWPEFQRGWLARGRLLWTAGHCADATAAWLQSSRLETQDQVARVDYAVGLYATGALRNWTAILSAREAKTIALQSAKALDVAQKSEEALHWYGIAEGYLPERSTTQMLAERQLAAGNRPAAIELWRQLVQTRMPTSADYWWATGQIAELNEHWTEAADAYYQGIAYSNSPYPFWLKVGDSLGYANWSQAEIAYHTALQINPNEAWAYLGIGHARLSQGDLAGAEEWYEQAERIAPGELSPKYYLGVLFFMQRQWPRATGYFAQALQIDPRHAASIFYVAQCNFELGKRQEAERLLGQAIQLRQDRPWQWQLLLGDWQMQEGERDSARQSYQTVIDWNPQSIDAQSRLQQLSSP